MPAARALPTRTARGGILLVTTCWWPSLAHLAHLLVQAGCRVWVLCPAGHPVHAAAGVTVRLHRGLDPVRTLSVAVGECRPEMVVPADDRAVRHLQQLHRTGTLAERALVERSIGDAEGFEATASRSRLLAVARSLGIAVPDGTAIAGSAELEAWMDRVPAPWVLKVDGAWGGDGVRICATRPEARAAFGELRRWLNLGRALRRLVIRGDPFWMSDWTSRATPEVTVQAHVAREPGQSRDAVPRRRRARRVRRRDGGAHVPHRPVDRGEAGRPARGRRRCPAPRTQAAAQRLPRPRLHGRDPHGARAADRDERPAHDAEQRPVRAGRGSRGRCRDAADRASLRAAAGVAGPARGVLSDGATVGLRRGVPGVVLPRRAPGPAPRSSRRCSGRAGRSGGRSRDWRRIWCRDSSAARPERSGPAPSATGARSSHRTPASTRTTGGSAIANVVPAAGEVRTSSVPPARSIAQLGDREAEPRAVDVAARRRGRSGRRRGAPRPRSCPGPRPSPRRRRARPTRRRARPPRPPCTSARCRGCS